MMGAMVALAVIGALAQAAPGLPGVVVLAAGLAVAIPVCIALGLLIERVAYRPLRHAPRLAPLITAIGVSIILQNVAMLIWGKQYIPFRSPAASFVRATRPPRSPASIAASTSASATTHRRSSVSSATRSARADAEGMRHRFVTTAACKAAIKVHHPLSREAMQKLLNDLLRTANPTTCPHGRPILFRLEDESIERAFRRR